MPLPSPFSTADGGQATMNLKELVAVVSAETQIPASQVRKVTQAILGQFVELIEAEGKFTSPSFTVSGAFYPARPATEDHQARPERKFARMRIKRKKTQIKMDEH